MELDNLERLLEKYENAETTLEEEKRIQEYFRFNEVPAHLAAYKSIFNYTGSCKEVVYPNPVKTQGNKRRFMLTGIAASVLLTIGVFGWQKSTENVMASESLGTVESPEQAYEKTKEALQMVAQAFDTGRKELIYLNEIDKTKNKYFNN